MKKELGDNTQFIVTTPDSNLLISKVISEVVQKSAEPLTLVSN